MAEPKGGYIKIFRKAYETSPYWLEKRRFSRWEAWEWILQTAPWGEGYTVSAEGHTITIPRGHILVSSRHLGREWQWANASVWRFLKRLESEKTIATVSETPLGTLYLIVNYEVYQGNETVSETPSETENETAVKQQRNEIKKNKQNKQNTEYSGDFEFFWNAYPKREGGDSKGRAYKEFAANLKRGVAHDVMFEKLKEYSAFVIAKGWVGTPYVMKACNWLGREEGYKREWKVAAAPVPEARKVAGVIPISRGPIQW